MIELILTIYSVTVSLIILWLGRQIIHKNNALSELKRSTRIIDINADNMYLYDANEHFRASIKKQTGHMLTVFDEIKHIKF